jgi:hypothetical protein
MQSLETCFKRSELNASRVLPRIERVPNVSLVAFELVTVPACRDLFLSKSMTTASFTEIFMLSSWIAAPFGG